MHTERITSASNPKIKNLLLLQEKSRARKEQGLFVVEGRRELSHCIGAGFRVRTLFICPEIAGGTSFGYVPSGGMAALGRDTPKIRGFSGAPLPNPSRGPSLLGKDSPARGVPDDGTYPKDVLSVTEDTTVIEITEALYRKVAYRESTEGIIAEVEAKENHLEQLELPENPLVVVLEGVEKPGNLGAVLRSADAAKADAVIVADPLTDLWNPNLIRASIGAVFTVPTFAVSTVEAIGWLQSHGFSILTAQLQDSLPYYDTPMTGPTAIVMGTESTGLTDPWRRAATAHIRIPMLGRLDSLNVSVSAAILLFEAIRQRRKTKD